LHFKNEILRGGVKLVNLVSRNLLKQQVSFIWLQQVLYRIFII